MIMLIIFGIEMLVFIIMIYPSLNKPILTVPSITLLISFLQKTTNNIKHNPYSLIPFIFRLIIITLAAITILWYIKLFLINIGQVFSEWDSTVYWMTFTDSWSANKIPKLETNLWRYPQLLPANWSLPYVLTNSKVQLFAKSIMALFPLYILILMLDLALRNKSIGYYIGIIATGILMKIFLVGYYIEYTDIPVSFFVFLAIYSLISCDNTDDPMIKKKFVFLGAIFAIGALLTKFVGLMIGIIYPFLSSFVILKGIMSVKLSDKFKYIALIFIVFSIFVALFAILIPSHFMDTINSFVKPAMNKQLLLVKDAIQLISSKIPIIYLLFFIILPLSFSVFDKICGLLIIIMILPFLYIWSVPVYMNELRYLSPVIPPIGLSVGKGIENMLSITQRVWQKFKKTHVINMQSATEDNDIALFNNAPQQKPLFRIKLFEILIFLGFFLVVPTLLYSPKYLVDRQTFLQKQIGYTNINQMVYAYQNTDELTGKIASNYQYLGHLPGFENHYGFFVFKDYDDYDSFRKDPNYHYFLICTFPDWGVNQKIVDDIKNRINTGEYQLIDQTDFVYFVKIK